jgi:hypothetical protein
VLAFEAEARAIHEQLVAVDTSHGGETTALRPVHDLARKKTALSRDVILALTAGEETGGFEGVQWLLKSRPELIAAEVALNEGGGLVATPDFGDIQLVGIGVAEKQYQSYRIIARGGGGHSSAPKPGEDPALALARAVVKVGELRFPARVLPEVRASFAAAAAWEKPPLDGALRHAAQSAPKLAPEDERIIAADRAYGSLVRTTCVTTMLKGSPQDNVLPTTAEAVVNCRIMPDETRAQTLAALVKAIRRHEARSEARARRRRRSAVTDHRRRAGRDREGRARHVPARRDRAIHVDRRDRLASSARRRRARVRCLGCADVDRRRSRRPRRTRPRRATSDEVAGACGCVSARRGDRDRDAEPRAECSSHAVKRPISELHDGAAAHHDGARVRPVDRSPISGDVDGRRLAVGEKLGLP